jgi:P27 family predicted phage terminase small subunit
MNPRKPTTLKLLEGTYRPDRANALEPQPARLIPKPPRHLSPRARKAWPMLSEILDQQMGILTAADAIALEAVAENYAKLLEARATLRQHGSLTVESGSGMLRPHPAVAMAADADRRLRAWLNSVSRQPPGARCRRRRSRRRTPSPIFKTVGTPS